MFRFENAQIFYLLLLIPALIAGYLMYKSGLKKRMRKFAELSFFSELMPDFSLIRLNAKFILFLLSIIFLVVALARPQFGSKLKEVKREGIEIIIALDVSNSMMATDITPNRLERAKQAVNTLINKMSNDKIGLIIFAGDAYTQLPITSDYVSAKMFLSSVSPDIVSRQGTAIGKAIDLGVKSFPQSSESSKVLVVISDGENHEGNAYDAAKNAAEKGIKVYTIGMGSPSGSLIPLKNGSGFVTDKEGNPVTSRLNAEMLSKIASNGGGDFFLASSSNVGLNKLYNDLQKLEKVEYETQVYSEYEDQFVYILGVALLLLLIEFLVLERKNKWIQNIKIFR